MADIEADKCPQWLPEICRQLYVRIRQKTITLSHASQTSESKLGATHTPEFEVYNSNQGVLLTGSMAMQISGVFDHFLQSERLKVLTMMKQIIAMSRGRGGAAILTLLLAAALPLPALSQPTGISPKAEQLLKASTDFLASQQQFSLDTSSSIDVVIASGQKLQFDHTASLSVQRPNKLRAERTGALVDQVFYYDGTSLTLHNPSENYYATVPAPGTLEEMLDFAREKLDIVAPASDLLYKDAYAILTQDVTSGFVVGKGVVDGVRCDHLAFRAPHVDWQIWIEEGARPLPRKLVITTRDKANAPQFTVVMTNWNLAPKFTDEMFSFQPPKCPNKVEFLLKGADAPKAQ